MGWHISKHPGGGGAGRSSDQSETVCRVQNPLHPACHPPPRPLSFTLLFKTRLIDDEHKETTKKTSRSKFFIIFFGLFFKLGVCSMCSFLCNSHDVSEHSNNTAFSTTPSSSYSHGLITQPYSLADHGNEFY